MRAEVKSVNLLMIQVSVSWVSKFDVLVPVSNADITTFALFIDNIDGLPIGSRL